MSFICGLTTILRELNNLRKVRVIIIFTHHLKYQTKKKVFLQKLPFKKFTFLINFFY
jgi:hypothetical protein